MGCGASSLYYSQQIEEFNKQKIEWLKYFSTRELKEEIKKRKLQEDILNKKIKKKK